MIPLLSIPVALAFPTLEGWLALRILEGNAPVLYRPERLCAGFLLGCTLSAFVIFWAVIAGVPLTVWGFLGVHGVMVVGLYGLNSVLGVGAPTALSAQGPGTCVGAPHRGALWWQWCQVRWCLFFPALGAALGRPYQRLVLFWMVIWMAVKIAAGGYDLLISPPYFDDVYANWNMRAKAFYLSEDLLLDLPRDHEFYFGGRVPGYPMTVYFTKVWLAMVAGGWSESIVNSVHFFWFLAFLVCFACALLRFTKGAFAIIGTYVLVSLPLFLVHGTNAYSDVLMAGHVFLVLYSFYAWVLSVRETASPKSQIPNPKSQTWLRLFGFATAMMVFVKNEALLIFLPPILFLFVGAWWMQGFYRGLASVKWRRAHGASLREIAIWFSMVLAVAFPWWLFKTMNGLTFGNAQDVKGMLASLSPNAAVFPAIGSDLFYTGNYLLLFPVVLLLLALTWRRWVRSPLSVLILFAATVFVGEVGIYAFARPLATEAIRHTGFGRGMVHLLPLLVFISVVLLRDFLGERGSAVAQ